MINDVVKYSNELNKLSFNNFTPKELDIFFTIISKVSEKGSEPISLSFEELKRLTNYKRKSINDFLKLLSSMYNKLLSLNYEVIKIEDDDSLVFEKYNVFSSFKIKKFKNSTGYVIITVSDEFIPLFNDLLQWTRFSLEEFVSLENVYSKNLYRLLKQYRTTGIVKISKSDFIELFNVPSSYRETNINQRILEPSIKELSPIFEGLKVKKIKSSGKGVPVIGYLFSFKADSRTFSKKASAKHKKITSQHKEVQKEIVLSQDTLDFFQSD